MTSIDSAAHEFQFTSESVTAGHPQDPRRRIACEPLITAGLIVVAGEISTTATLDIQKLARERIRASGHTRAEFGFDADTCGAIVTLDEQSPDIAQGVDTSDLSWECTDRAGALRAEAGLLSAGAGAR